MFRNILTIAITASVCLSGVARPVASDALFATTTTYEATGSCSAMNLQAPYAASNNLYTVHSDAVVRWDDNLIFVVNRYLGDNILVLNAAGYGVVTQYSTGLNSNPYDLEVVSPGIAYIPRYELNTLLVVNPGTGATLGTVDLSGFADADGKCEMSQCAAFGEHAFVAIQRLDRNQPLWPPVGGSGIAVIDRTSHTLVDANPGTPAIDLIDLALENPFGDLWYDRALDRLVVVCAGTFATHDGGIEAVHPLTLQRDRVLVTEAQLGGDLVAARIVSPHMGWAIVSNAQFATCLVRFDPSSGERIDTVSCTTGFDLSDLEVGTDGRVYVSDRTAQNPGVRIYDGLSGALVGGPIGLGLPPFDLQLRTPSTVSDAGTAPLSALTASPNPFRNQVTIRMGGPTLAAQPALEIIDVRGRVVDVVRPEATGATGTVRYAWQGIDVHGGRLPSGVYYARPRGGRATALQLLLIR